MKLLLYYKNKIKKAQVNRTKYNKIMSEDQLAKSRVLNHL